MRITLKLALALMFGILVVLVFHALHRSEDGVALVEADAREDLAIVARVLGDAVEVIWRTESRSAARGLVKATNDAHRDLDIRWVGIEDPKFGLPELPPEVLRPLSSGEQQLVVRTNDKEQPRLYLYRNLDLPGSPGQALELQRSLASDEARERAIRLDEIKLASLLLLVTSLITAGVCVILIGRPLNALRDQVRAVAHGAASEPLPIDESGEIGDLAREVSHMSREVQAARQRVAEEAAAREDALESLRHAERLASVGKLASIVAHELGTPLNVISARAEMIATGESKDAEAVSSARIIVEQSARMSRIIKEVLGNVRKGKPTRKKVGVGELLNESIALVSRLAKKRHVRLELAGDQGAHAVEVDGSRIVQVLTNLITNGIQSMPNGGSIEIEVSRVDAKAEEHRAPAGYTCIAVRDHGVGISAENLKDIFKPFFTTKSDSQGTGLGLAVAEGIVREHGGWLDVESEIDKGSTFKVCLPSPT